MVEKQITHEQIIAPVKDDLARLETLMIACADGYHQDLIAAVEHIISSGGKRIRPAISFLVGRIYDLEQTRLDTLAASIEMLHTATLVHDDLIDGSLLRRGSPTLNASWSPAATVLTGDFLFAKAAEFAAATDSPRLLKKFAQTLSTIVNGELNQIFMSKGLLSREDYYTRIYAKTASLLELCTSSPAILAENEDHIILLEKFGRKIGMAFQIVDDILDFVSDESDLGKPIASDLKQGLFTLPTIYYFEQNPDNELVQKVLHGNASDEEMFKVFQAIKDSNAVSDALAEARQEITESLEILDKLNLGEEDQILRDVAAYIINREF